MDDSQFSVAAAREAADRDGLATWVATFLASPGSDNAPLAEDLLERFPYWAGPLEVPFAELHRLAGPQGDPVLCPVEDEEWGDNVDHIRENIEEGWVPPPLIVSLQGGRLVLEDGNHRVEGLRRARATQAWAVIAFESKEEREAFTLRFA